MAIVIGDVQLVAWDGGSLFVGSASAIVPAHAHQAIQLTFGMDADVRFRGDDEGPWTSYRVAVIAFRQPHAMDATNVTAGVVLFVEPETREGRALTDRFAHLGIAEGYDPAAQPAIDRLFAAFRARAGDAAIESAARAVVQVLTRGVEPSVVSDERILKAIEYIKTHLDATITLNDVASHIYLSPGRLRHLFVEQTGMGLRAYVLWRRLFRVWQVSMQGTSLSTAAHSAGFADSAHLTRTSKKMIGLAPSVFRVSKDPAALQSAPERGAGTRA